ncbi:hypothetical protein [Ferdinandcohnia sp. Marseille-Q9671]
MNFPVLKDVKAVIGFIMSLMLVGIAIVLATKNNSYWVVFVVLSLMVSYFSVRRADKITNS